MTQLAPRIREWTTKSGVKRRKMEYPVVCACGSVRYLFKEDIPRSRQCKKCNWRQRGKRGWAKTEAKLSHQYGGLTGRKLWVEMARRRCENNVMPSELAMSDLLQGIPYERNVVIDCGSHSWIVDFLIAGRLVLEINGGVHRLHQARDSRKYTELLAMGYALVVIDDDEISLDWLFKGLY